MGALGGGECRHVGMIGADATPYTCLSAANGSSPACAKEAGAIKILCVDDAPQFRLRMGEGITLALSM